MASIQVTIGLGDKSNSVDSRHSATVEGFTIIPAFRTNSNGDQIRNDDRIGYRWPT